MRNLINMPVSFLSRDQTKYGLSQRLVAWWTSTSVSE